MRERACAVFQMHTLRFLAASVVLDLVLDLDLDHDVVAVLYMANECIMFRSSPLLAPPVLSCISSPLPPQICITGRETCLCDP